MGAPTARIAAAVLSRRQHRTGDRGGGHRLMVMAGGAISALVALLLFVAIPAILITGQLGRCDPGMAEGVPDATTLNQVQVAARIVQVGEETDRSERHEIAALATGLVESELRNLPPGVSDNDANPNKPSRGISVTSVGVFQQQNLPTWTRSGRDRMNVRDAARSFYEQAQLVDRPGMTIGQLAQAVQGSAHPEKYDLRVDEARRL